MEEQLNFRKRRLGSVDINSMDPLKQCSITMSKHAFDMASRPHSQYHNHSSQAPCSSACRADSDGSKVKVKVSTCFPGLKITIKKCIVTVITLILALVLVVHLKDILLPDESRADFITWVDISTNKQMYKKKCTYGFFNLKDMNTCRRWLQCKDFNKVKLVKKLGQGAVKVAYLATWNNHLLVHNSLINQAHGRDFHHCVAMLQGLSGSQLITQFVGRCGDTFLTEYYPLGNLLNFVTLEKNNAYSGLLTLQTRLQLCVNYIEVLYFLHNSPLGIRVMCDSNDLEKTLAQFLMREDFKIAANDLDALPEVNITNNMLVKCGHRELDGDFIAPEQLWPYEEVPFMDAEMPAYTEKIDIWKIPDVCNYFLGRSIQADAARMHLFKIHTRCKDTEPTLRPSANDVLVEYKKVMDFFSQS